MTTSDLAYKWYATHDDEETIHLCAHAGVRRWQNGCIEVLLLLARCGATASSASE